MDMKEVTMKRTSTPGSLEMAACYQVVRYLARHLMSILPSNLPYEDLVAEGLLALVECRDRYDPTSTATFSTYAYPRVKGAILSALSAERRYHAHHQRTGKEDRFVSGTTPERVAEHRERLAAALRCIEVMPADQQNAMKSIMENGGSRGVLDDLGVRRDEVYRWRQECREAVR